MNFTMLLILRSATSLLTDDSENKEEYDAVSVDLLIEIEEICARNWSGKTKVPKSLLTLVAKKLKIACNETLQYCSQFDSWSLFIRDDLMMKEEAVKSWRNLLG